MLGYERETFRRETMISATAPARLDENGLTFERAPRAARRVDDGPRRRHGWPASGERQAPAQVRDAAARTRATWSRTSTRWIDEAPRLECDWER